MRYAPDNDIPPANELLGQERQATEAEKVEQ